MNEQYEQIADWGEWMKAVGEGSLYFDKETKVGEIVLDKETVSIINFNMVKGHYYRKIEPEQMELVEWERIDTILGDPMEAKWLPKGEDELRPWFVTGRKGILTIKGVRVKA